MSASVSSKSTRGSSKKSHVPAPVEVAAPVAPAVAEETHHESSASEGTASEASEYVDEEDEDEDEDDEDDDDEDDDEEGDDVSQVNIDLSNNEFYKGMCTLLEDENGNNIVQYIDLLCDETKEIADNTKHLDSIKNDIHKMAKLFERWVMLEEAKARHAGISLSGSSSRSDMSTLLGSTELQRKSLSSSHHHSSSSRSGGDDASVHTSKSSKSTKKH